MTDLDTKALEAAARAVGICVCKAYAEDAIWAEDVEWQQRRQDPGAPFNTARAAVSAYLAAAPSDELWIGEYMLQRGPTNGIWIGRRGGEGGQFATDDVERVIAQFYRVNF